MRYYLHNVILVNINLELYFTKLQIKFRTNYINSQKAAKNDKTKWLSWPS